MTKEELRADAKTVWGKKTAEEKKESLLRLFDEIAREAANVFKSNFTRAYLNIKN